MRSLFSSESVSEGHPDKLCDQISDAILDAALAVDPDSRVAAEVFATTGLVLIGGELASKAVLDYQSIARRVIRDIGYTHPDYGMDADSCAVLVAVHGQSPDIAQGVNEGEGLHKDLGAGDQGMMFGYACDQTDEYMPLPIALSHRIVRQLAQYRKQGVMPELRPDAKAQVTIEYDGRTPVRVDAIVVSTQHHPDVDQDTLARRVKQEVIASVIPSHLIDQHTRFFINPTGRFVIGGPHGDTGLTGRKIIVDTYGGWARHGGGAFSGKDYTKVDRSAAYMARYMAKNIVAAGLAKEAEIQLAYAIGVAEPVSVMVDTKGTGVVSDEALVTLIRQEFDLTPKGIVTGLSLKKPTYHATAAYGHFGRTDVALTWEDTTRATVLRDKYMPCTSGAQ